MGSASSQRSQKIDWPYDSDTFKRLELGEVTIARDDQVGVPGHGTFDDPVVVGIVRDDVRFGPLEIRAGQHFPVRGRAYSRCTAFRQSSNGTPRALWKAAI
jgi:hypothetical protein